MARRRALRRAAAACVALTAGCSSVPDAVNPVSWYDGARDALVGTDGATAAAEPSNTTEPVAARPAQGPSGLVADRDNARHTAPVALSDELRSQPPRPAAKPLVQVARAEPVPEPSPPPQAPAAAPPPPQPASQVAAETDGKAAGREPAPDEDRDHFTVPHLASRPAPPPVAPPESPAPSGEAVGSTPLSPPGTDDEPYHITRPPLRTEAYIGGTAEASMPPDMRRPEREPFGPGSRAPVSAEGREATGDAMTIDVTGSEIRRPPLRTESFIGGTAEAAMPAGPDTERETGDREAAPPIQTARPRGRLIPDVPPAIEPPAAEPSMIPPPAQAPIERLSPSDERRSRVPDVLPATGISTRDAPRAAPPPRPAFSQIAARVEPPPPPPAPVAMPEPPARRPQLAAATPPTEDGVLAPQPLDGVVFGAPPGDIDPTASAEFVVDGRQTAPREPFQVAAAVDTEPGRVPVALSELIVQPVDDPSRIASVLFENGSAKLDSEARGIVEQVARLLKAEGGQLKVVGHASSRTRNMPMIRHRMVNLTLSMQRAQAVAQALNRLGVSNDAISVEAVSDTDPVLREVMPAAEGPNRRTEIFLER